jgi:hypothetical protein
MAGIDLGNAWADNVWEENVWANDVWAGQEDYPQGNDDQEPLGNRRLWRGRYRGLWCLLLVPLLAGAVADSPRRVAVEMDGVAESADVMAGLMLHGPFTVGAVASNRDVIAVGGACGSAGRVDRDLIRDMPADGGEVAALAPTRLDLGVPLGVDLGHGVHRTAAPHLDVGTENVAAGQGEQNERASHDVDGNEVTDAVPFVCTS